MSHVTNEFKNKIQYPKLSFKWVSKKVLLVYVNRFYRADLDLKTAS